MKPPSQVTSPGLSGLPRLSTDRTDSGPMLSFYIHCRSASVRSYGCESVFLAIVGDAFASLFLPFSLLVRSYFLSFFTFPVFSPRTLRPDADHSHYLLFSVPCSASSHLPSFHSSRVLDRSPFLIWLSKIRTTGVSQAVVPITVPSVLLRKILCCQSSLKACTIRAHLFAIFFFPPT